MGVSAPGEQSRCQIDVHDTYAYALFSIRLYALLLGHDDENLVD